MFRIVAVLLFALTTSLSVPPNCLVRDDFLFHWNITKEQVFVFQIAAPTKFTGWTAIGWSSENSTKESHMFLVYQNESKLIMNQIDDHYQVREPSEVDFKNFKQLDSLLPQKFIFFQFEVDGWNMPDNEYIFFAFNNLITPTSPQNISRHNYQRTLKIKLSENVFPSCAVVRPGIAETMNLYVYIASLVFNFFVLILYLLLQNEQPLKSRGTLPIFAIIAHFIYYMTHFPEFLSLEWRNYFICFIMMINYSALQSSYILIPLTFFRYLIIVNLNKQKQHYYNERQQGKDEEIKVSKIFKLLDFFTSTSTSLFFITFYFFIMIIIYVLVSSNDNWKCTERVLTSNSLIFTASNFTIGGAIFLLQFYDIIANIKTWLRCQLLDFFIRKDPFLFRSELLFVNFFIPLYCLNIFYFYYEYSEVYFYMNSVLLYWLYWIQILFILTITVLKKISKLFCSRNRSAISEDEIEWVMSIPELKEMFINFSRKEWSLENILIYEDLLKFKKISSKKQKLEYANIIFDRYLAVNSHFEVNVDEDLRYKVFQKIEFSEIDSSLFDEIQIALQLNLLDTLSRLKEENHYKRFEYNYKIEKDLLYREEKFI
eukprot:gene3294-5735_t